MIAIFNYVLFIVPGLSTSSSTTPTPTSSLSSSQDSAFDVSRYTENPVHERSGSRSEELRGNPMQRSKETENKNKNEGREEVQSDQSHELPEWLQEFRENLVDERSLSEPRGKPEPGYRDTFSSSHELPRESRAKVERGSGKHCVQTHFPKDPNCDICKLRHLLENPNYELFLQKTHLYSRAQSGNFRWLDNRRSHNSQ